LCLVLGSSLTVKPACNMPGTVGENPNGRLVICNLQNTPYDSVASLKINARTDDLMKLVIEKLGLDIPKFILSRRLCVERTGDKVLFQTFDFDGTLSSVFSEVIINHHRLTSEPFVYNNSSSTPLDVTFKFFGHYNEPNLDIKLLIPENKNYYDLFYDPMTGLWDFKDIGPKVEFPPPFRRTLTKFQRSDNTQHVKNKPVPAIQGGFSVYPKRNCPHFSSQTRISVINEIEKAFKKNICYKCKDSSENWICLSCGETHCSRYVKGDAQTHFDETSHSIAISFSDLSIWCYSCNDYITHSNLEPFVGEVTKVKFG